MIKNIKFYSLVISSYIISYFSIFLRFLQHDLEINNSFDNFFFNSDAIFFNNISKDVIMSNGEFSSWLLAGAPEIFPTIFLSFLIPMITKNFFVSQIIFSIVQLLFFNILLIGIIKAFTEKKYAIQIGVLTNIILVSFLYTEPFNFIFIASHHFGCFINFLICLLFVCTKNIQRPLNFIILSLLFFIFSFSNPIFIPYFVFPFIICSQILSNSKINIIKNIYFLVLSFSAYYIKKVIYFHDCNICLNTYQEMDNFYFDAILISLYHIKEFFLIHSNFTQNSIVATSLLIFIYYTIQFLRVSKRDYPYFRKNFIMILFLFLSSFFTLICFLFLHMNPQFRHLFTLYFSPFLIIPIVSYNRIKYFINMKNNSFLIICLLMILLTSFINLDFNKKINFEYYPKDIEFIDKVLNRYDLNQGYAKWEYGNRLVFLSKKKLKVISYHEKKPLHWDTKKDWLNLKPQFLININPEVLGFEKFKTIKKDLISIHIL